MRILEVLHAYDAIDFNTQYHPLRTGDSFRVYHGYRDFHHAVEAARYGLSGKERADRVYSYEYDNNPNGLFITLSFKVASEFVGSYGPDGAGVVMEFNADLDELEPPVWPGGSYTVQGQMAQYFGHGAKGRAARRQRARDAEQEVTQRTSDRDDLSHIRDSDKKLLADLLTNSREAQALYVGHLDPKRITAFHVREQPQINAPFVKLTREEFLERYASYEIAKDNKVDKIFEPNEPFDGDKFLNQMASRYSGGGVDETDNMLLNAFQDIMTSQNRTQQFISYFERYLWPRQHRDALNWMRRRYRG